MNGTVVSFSSLGNQSDKPRVRAEPDEPKAPLCVSLIYAEYLSHRLLAFNHDSVGIMHYTIADCIGNNRRADLVTPARYINWEQKIIEPFL